MIFDATINLGNVLTGIGTIAGVLWAYHNWDKKVEVRHVVLKSEIKNIDQKVDRVESKIDENTKTTNGVGDRMIELKVQVEKHCAVDESVQKEISRRLDRMEK